MSVWEEVKNRVQIEEVIGEYVPIFQAGRNFKCLSPFRQEKTPSLIISPEKNIWHDFGSGDGGDVFEFVARMENISRYEAMKKLAEKVGVQVTFNQADKSGNSRNVVSEKIQEVDDFDRGLSLLAWSAKIYNQILTKALQSRSNPITEYCLKRGLTQEVVQTFSLGYAPKDNFLVSLAKKHSVDLDLLYEVGLLKKIDQQSYDLQFKDKFADRLMIPVKDLSGRVVGFTGRVLPYDKSERPKYLNSPQTDWFNKSRIWYGWDLNRKNLVQQRVALIVEGNMDVIAAYRHDLRFALASQGTSFTVEQLRILKSYADTLWMAFDNDEAGRIAGKKLFLEATKLGFNAKKLIIPAEFKDLDEYLAELSKMVEPSSIQSSLKIVGYLDWQIDQKGDALGGDNLDKQREGLRELAELLVVMDEVSQEQYATKLHKLTGISKSTILNLVKSSGSHESRSPSLETATDKPEIRQYQDILVAWQKLAGYYLFFEQAKPSEVFIDRIFQLLKKFFESLNEHELLEQYLVTNRSILELVWEEAKELASEEYLQRLKQMLINFIDQRVDQFLLDSNKYQAYLELKQESI